MVRLNNDKYIVEKGDTLSHIAKKLGVGTYDLIAGTNGIKNPDKIYPGQIIQTPKVSKTPYKLKNIPTKNRVNIIDNYSPKYNYIVEGNKIYYSIKGRDYWVDISENDIARKNLYTFLNDKYNFKGYEDGEKDLYNEYKKRNKFSYNIKTFKPSTTKNPIYEKGIANKFIEKNNSTKISKPLILNKTAKPILLNKTKIQKPVLKNNEESKGLSDYILLGKNYITRMWNKLFGSDEKSEMQVPKILPENSKYITIPKSFYGKPKDVTKRQYIIPENINLNQVKLGYRNRGDYKDINTEGAIITSLMRFNDYSYYKPIKNDNRSFIGIDKDGNFKLGNLSKFGPGDILTQTYSNKVIGIARDSKGRPKMVYDSKHGNASRKVPVMLVQDDNGNIIESANALNILSERHSNATNTFGSISGGRAIIESKGISRLISGSIDDIEKQINHLKTLTGSKYVNLYLLDNGTYNKGFRTKDKMISSQDWKNYDNSNTSGGNVLYLLNTPEKTLKYPSDTLLTPNIRNKQSDSYKKGHPLVNERRGVVLHHTAFTEPNLNNVLNRLTDPKTEVSSHVVIGYDGSRKVLATPDKVTYHAGYSRLRDRNDVNDYTIGIEFLGDTNLKDLTDDQVNSAVEYLLPIILENNIPFENIVTHLLVRLNYINWQKLNKQTNLVPGKPDINARNYRKIQDALLKSGVFVTKNKNGGILKGLFGLTTPILIYPRLKNIKRYYDILSNYVKRKTQKPRKLTKKVGGPGTDIIDLSKNVVRVTPNSKLKTALFNEFIETKNRSIYPASVLKTNKIQYFGDNKIPFNNINLYMGIENEKFKVDSLKNFNDTTTLIPVRNIKKNIKPIKKILITPEEKDVIKAININNDTLPISNYNLGLLDTKKLLLGNSKGNSLFIGDFTKLSPNLFDYINLFLGKNPSFPIRTDLGSYELYKTNNPSYLEYMDQFFDVYGNYNPNSHYIIGTK